MIEQLIQSMQTFIERCGLVLMQHYPNDLLVHDRSMLETHAHPGAVFGWVVGDLHTHMVPLGLHPRLNEEILHLTRLSSRDCFFVVRIDPRLASGFHIQQLDGQMFEQLSLTHVPYGMVGSPSSFCLRRDGRPVGRVAIECCGTYDDRIYRATIVPDASATALDRAALATWTQRSICAQAGSLFVRTELHWTESATSAAAPALLAA